MPIVQVQGSMRPARRAARHRLSQTVDGLRRSRRHWRAGTAVRAKDDRHVVHAAIVVQRDLGAVNAPTLVLQCSDDVIAPRAVGEYVHRHVPDSQLVMMNATGHCPNLSAPDETVREIRTLLQSLQ